MDLSKNPKEIDIIKSRQKYKLSKRVIEIIQNANGYIFGGAVRDMILHNYNAEEFYIKTSKEFLEELNKENLTESEKDDEVYNWDLYEKPKKYNDPDIYPEFIDRFLYPNDIDCLMSIESKKIFLMMLKIHRLRYKELTKAEPLQIYMKNVDPLNVKLKIQKYQVTFDLDELFVSVMQFDISDLPVINLDIITQENIRDTYPPFGDIDFECNSLILTPQNNYMLSPHFILDINTPKYKLYKMQKIIRDIESKIAVVNKRVPLYRLNKMKERGWKIIAEFGDKIYRLEKKTDNEEEICPLCCEKFNIGEYCLRRSCCKSSVYHQDCFKKLMDLNVKRCCPICSDEFNEKEKDRSKIELY